MSDYVLYNYFRSSTSYRVRIALFWKEVSFRYKPVHLVNNGGEQHTQSYDQLNPMHEVPTLEHKGKFLGQSLAIIEYLDQTFPQKPLFPKDAWERAHVKQLCENINCGIHPITNLKVMQYLEKELSVSAEKKDLWVKEWVSRGLRAMEKSLSSYMGTYALGSAVTAVDLFVVPQLFSAERFKVDLSEFRGLRKISENCLKLEAFQKAHPYRQPDTPDELRIS